MLKTLFKTLGVLLVLLIVVMAFNTWRYQPKNASWEQVDLPKIDTPTLSAHLSRAIQFKTISMREFPAGRPADFSRFTEWLTTAFPAATGVMDRQMINGLTPLYRWQGSDTSQKPILLTAHYDVVPVENEGGARWQYPPFEGRIADGFVWGRGAMDDKGALVAMMGAAEQLAREGFQPARTLYFSFGHDEEIGGAEGASAVADYLQGQGVQLDWSLDEGSAVLRDIVPGLSTDIASINVAEKGYITVDITAHGEGGHSSLPPRRTAVGELAEALVNLQAAPVDGGLSGASKEFFDALGPNFSLAQRVLFANQWLFRPVLELVLSGSASTDAMLRTTMAPTMLSGSSKENVLPQQAVATVNYRLHPRDSIADILAHTHDKIDNPTVDVTLRDGFQSAASEVSSAQNEAFALLSQTFGQVFGDVIIVPGLTIAGTDSRHYARVADNSYRINPFVMTSEDIPRLHGVNERLSLVDLERATQFYMLLLRNGTQ